MVTLVGIEEVLAVMTMGIGGLLCAPPTEVNAITLLGAPPTEMNVITLLGAPLIEVNAITLLGLHLMAEGQEGTDKGHILSMQSMKLCKMFYVRHDIGF